MLWHKYFICDFHWILVDFTIFVLDFEEILKKYWKSKIFLKKKSKKTFFIKPRFVTLKNKSGDQFSATARIYEAIFDFFFQHSCTYSKYSKYSKYSRQRQLTYVRESSHKFYEIRIFFKIFFFFKKSSRQRLIAR